TGVDPSAAGLAAARQRAAGVGLADRARFQHGTFEHTNLAEDTADAVMSIDALQYARASAPRSPSWRRSCGPARGPESYASRSIRPGGRPCRCAAWIRSPTTGR